MNDNFSSTVSEAEDKFAAACRSAGLPCVSIQHPSKGPGGESIHVQVSRAGSEAAQNVLLVISGTHGVEGYAGAGIQTGLLRNLASYDIREDVSVVFVHLINPWGCAWGRRETQENIDLFRNFLYRDPPFLVNQEYDRLAPAICPAQWHGPEKIAADNQLAHYVSGHGYDSLIELIRRGQHDHPQGLTFHGRGPSWSKSTMDRIARNFLGNARRIACYDVHTGYGRFGEGQVVCFHDLQSPVAVRLEKWFREPFLLLGQDPMLPSHGRSAYDYLGDLFPQAELTSFALELGTQDATTRLELIRQINWIFAHGDPLSSEGREAREAYRSIYYPETADWKHQVWVRGDQVFRTTLEGLRQEPNRCPQDASSASSVPDAGS